MKFILSETLSVFEYKDEDEAMLHEKVMFKGGWTVESQVNKNGKIVRKYSKRMLNNNLSMPIQ